MHVGVLFCEDIGPWLFRLPANQQDASVGLLGCLNGSVDCCIRQVFAWMRRSEADDDVVLGELRHIGVGWECQFPPSVRAPHGLFRRFH